MSLTMSRAANAVRHLISRKPAAAAFATASKRAAGPAGSPAALSPAASEAAAQTGEEWDSSNVLREAAGILLAAPEALSTGDVVLNLGAHTAIGQGVAVAAFTQGVVTVNVVSEDARDGYPQSVDHLYDSGADFVVTESFLSFYGFKELMDELGGSAKLVVNGSNFLGAGTTALEKIGAAKSFSDRRSLFEDLMASGELEAAKRASGVATAAGSAPTIHHSGATGKKGEKPFDFEAWVKSASPEQKEKLDDMLN